MSTIVTVKNLTKNFKDIKAVNNLSFSVEQGQIYGFLGQNGAGKSTTIRMLLTLIKPTSGSIEIFGLNLQKHRKEVLRQIGAIIERPHSTGEPANFRRYERCKNFGKEITGSVSNGRSSRKST